MNIGKTLNTLGKATTEPSSLGRGTSEGGSPLDSDNSPMLGEETPTEGVEEQEWHEDLGTRGQKEKKNVGDYLGDIARSPLAALGGLAESAYDLADWATGDDLLADWDRGHGSWGENWFDKSTTLPGGLVEGFLQFATFFVPGMQALGAAKAHKAATLAAKAAKGGKGAFGKSTAEQAARVIANNTVKGKKNFSAKELKLLKSVKKKSRQFAEMSAVGAVSDLMAFKGQEFRLSNLLTKMGGEDSPEIIKWLAHDPNEPEERHSEIEGRIKNMIEGFFVGSAVVGGVAAGKGLFKLLKRHPDAAKSAQERAARGEDPDPAADLQEAIERNPIDPDEAKALIQAQFRLSTEAQNAGIPEAVKVKAAEQSSPFQPWQKRGETFLRPKKGSSYANERTARSGVINTHKKDPDDYAFLPTDEGRVVPVLKEELERLGLARVRSMEEIAAADREMMSLAEVLSRRPDEIDAHVSFKDTEEWHIISGGGIMHPKKGRKKHPDMYEGFEEGMFGGGGPINKIHRRIFGPTGRAPDEVAKEMGAMNLIPGKDGQTATADDLWEHLGNLYRRGKKREELVAQQAKDEAAYQAASASRGPDVEKGLTFSKFKETQKRAREMESAEGLEPSPEFWWQKPREEPEGTAVTSAPNKVPQRPGQYGITSKHPDYAAQKAWDAKYKKTHNTDGTPKEGEGAVKWISEEELARRNEIRSSWRNEDGIIREGRLGMNYVTLLKKAEARRNQIREGWQKEDAEAGVIDPHDQPTTTWDDFTKERPYTTKEIEEYQRAADLGSPEALSMKGIGIKQRKPEADTAPVEGVAKAEETTAPPSRDEASLEPHKWNEAELDNFLKSKNVLPSFMDTATKRRFALDILKGKITEDQITVLREAAEDTLKKNGGWDPKNPRAVYSGARAAGDQADLMSQYMAVASEVLRKIRTDAPSPSASERVKLDHYKAQSKLAQEAADLMSSVTGSEPRKLNLEYFEGRADELAMFRADQTALFDGFLDAGRHVEEKFHAFQKAVDESTAKGLEPVAKARAELYSAMDYHLNVHKMLSRFGTEYSMGMSHRYLMFHGDTYTGSFRPTPVRRIGFDTPSEFALKADIDATDALHQGFRGGRSEKAVMKSIRKALAHDDPVERATALSKLLPSERNLMGMTQEWYLNALLGSPVTWTVNLTSNMMVMALGHFKLTTGALLTGNKELLKANFSAMFDIQNFVEALKFAKISLKTGESRSISGHTAYHDNRVDLSGHFTSQKFGVPKQRKVTDEDGNVTLENNGWADAIDFLGAVIRHPQKIMLAGDEFFKQWNFRARTKTLLGMEAYDKGITDPRKIAEYVEEGFEGLITKDGRFRNEANIYKEASQQAEKMGLVGKARSEHVRKYMDRHFRENEIVLEGPEGKSYSQQDFYSRKALVETGTDWALVQTFTNNPRNALTKNLSKLATFSPWLTFVIPFVRTPANILTYALSHTVPIGKPGTIRKAAIAGQLNRKKGGPTDVELSSMREVYEKMGVETPQADALARRYHDVIRRGNSVDAAEYLGRLSTAGMAVGGVFMFVEAIKDNITGSSPQGGPDREAWKIAGKQPYSIKIGDKWHSYQRMDPFATMLGIFVDIVHGFDRARLKERGIFGDEDDIEENASVIKKVVGVIATSMADNLTKKSYVENLSSFFDLLRRPTQAGPQLGGNIIGGFVPNALNVSQNVFEEEPAILESRKLLDKFMQKMGPLRPNVGETILTTARPMPQRNFLGEVRRKQNLGGLKGLWPFFSSDVSFDSVDVELEALQQGRATMSPMLTAGDEKINLRDYFDGAGNTAFDRMQEMTASGMGGGPSLRKALRMLIESRRYQSLPDITDNNLGPNHPRNKAITDVIDSFRSRAKREILKDFPELKADYIRMLQSNPYK